MQSWSTNYIRRGNLTHGNGGGAGSGGSNVSISNILSQQQQMRGIPIGGANPGAGAAGAQNVPISLGCSATNGPSNIFQQRFAHRQMQMQQQQQQQQQYVQSPLQGARDIDMGIN